MSARSWAREPMVHFAVLGLVLLGLSALLGTDAPPEAIVLGADTRARIEAQRARSLDREPTQAELDAAIRAWADQEMLYREARALELDRGDPIIRRRLTQKMRFLVEDSVELPEPSEAALEAWVLAHGSRFEHAPRVAWTHVFIAAPSAPGPHQSQPVSGEARVRELEAALAAGADPGTLGDPFELGQSMPAQAAAELDRDFGREFGEQVFALPDLGWHRLRSRFGWHLVHIDDRLPGELASVDEVREQARAGVLQVAREVAREQALAALRERYDIVIEDQG